jgi:hypothetical protein
LIRFRVPEVTPVLRDRIRRLPDARLIEHPDEATNGQMEVECLDVKATLFYLVATLNDLQVESAALETEEPNLERVFLHLTGRELRD